MALTHTHNPYAFQQFSSENCHFYSQKKSSLKHRHVNVMLFSTSKVTKVMEWRVPGWGCVRTTMAAVTHRLLVLKHQVRCGQFFRLCKIDIVFIDVAMCDPVHDVETIFHLRWLLKTSWNLFWGKSTCDARETWETAICSFPGFTHIPEKISRCC